MELCELEEAAYLVLQEEEEEGETSSSSSSDGEAGSQTESSCESLEEKISQPSPSNQEPLAVTLDMERLCISKEIGEEKVL